MVLRLHALMSAALMLTAAASFAGAPPKRPLVDLQAMQEAMVSSRDGDIQFPSAASYAHFLRARLAHHAGEHRVALDELRLALASDESNTFLMTELAEQFARMSELEKAELQLKKVLDAAPDYAPAQLMMGRVLYESQKTTRARTHLTRAIRLRPADPDAYLVLTQLCLDQGKVDEAVKVVEDLGAALPGEPIGFRRLGLALAERNESARAEKLLTRAVDRDPGDLESWVQLAKIYESSARLPKASEAYGRALERDPENGEVLLAAGRLALRTDNTVDAHAYFETLLSLSRDPEQVVKVAFSYLAVHQYASAAEVLDTARKDVEEPRLHFYAGLVHEKRHAWQKAADAFEAVPRELGDLSFEARMHRAMSMSALGQHKTALELFRKLSDEKPAMAGLDAAWARALERSTQVKEAEALLLKAFATRPSVDLLDAMGSFYDRQNRNAEAVSLFTTASQKQPKDEALTFALATALERLGAWQKSVEKMRTVLEANPSNAAALNFIGYTLADHGGDLDEAEKLVKRALDVRPDSAAYLDSMGWVLYKRGEFEKAVDYLERAVTEAPDEATLLEHLGDAAMKTSKRSKAVEAFKHALQLVVESPDAVDRRTQRTELERKLRTVTISEAASR